MKNPPSQPAAAGLLLLAIVLFSSPAFAGIQNIQKFVSGVHFAHKWVEKKCSESECVFESSYAPPVPFSWAYKVESILTVEVAPNTPQTPKTLKTILKHEIQNIRSSVALADYLEEDGKRVKDGIASWTETIGGKPVGFIKYAALPDESGGLPFGTIHGILRTDEATYYVHLITFFGGHQDEIRGDQREILKELAEKS